LKPILRKVWTLPGQRPFAPVEHRYAWRYLVGFVHPASGRTVWHLATTVSIELFSVELAAFAHQISASPTKQIVLVLDGAGWHDSPKVRVPEHVHLLFLPPHSPPTAASGAPVAVDQHRPGQPALRQHRGFGGCPGGAVRCPTRPPRSHPCDDAVLLVAAADSSAARSEAIVRSDTWSQHFVRESLLAPAAGSRLGGMTIDNRMVCCGIKPCFMASWEEWNAKSE
jgi:hypothetical protein